MVRACVLIKTKPGTSEDVLKAIKQKVKGIVAADSVYGQYDAIVVLDLPSPEEVANAIYYDIEKLPNVASTETALAVFHGK